MTLRILNNCIWETWYYFYDKCVPYVRYQRLIYRQ